MTKQELNSSLIARYHAGDRNALGELVEVNEGLVRSIAYRRAAKHGIKERDAINDDILQVARCAILHAAETYDSSKSQFTSYATPWVIRNVRQFLHSELGTIRVPYIRRSSVEVRKEADSIRWLRASGSDAPNWFHHLTVKDSTTIIIENEEKERRLRKVRLVVANFKKPQQKRIQALLDGNDKPPGHGVSRKTWKRSLNCSVRMIRNRLHIEGDMPEVKW